MQIWLTPDPQLSFSSTVPDLGCCVVCNDLIPTTRRECLVRSELRRESFVSSRTDGELCSGRSAPLPIWLGSLHGPCHTQDIAVGISLVCLEEESWWTTPQVFIRPMKMSYATVLNEQSHMEGSAVGRDVA